MSDQTRTIETMILAAQWERAKGELRALVALQGSYPSGLGNAERWIEARDAIEEFISIIEDNGLHEPA